MRTMINEIGQVETDEIYIGVDKQGVHYIFPVRAKGRKDTIGSVQIRQDFAVCADKFPEAIGRPIAAQFLDDETIVLFEFVFTEDGIKIHSEKQYQLVHNTDLSDSELEEYRNRIVN